MLYHPFPFYTDFFATTKEYTTKTITNFVLVPIKEITSTAYSWDKYSIDTNTRQVENLDDWKLSNHWIVRYSGHDLNTGPKTDNKIPDLFVRYSDDLNSVQIARLLTIWIPDTPNYSVFIWIYISDIRYPDLFFRHIFFLLLVKLLLSFASENMSARENRGRFNKSFYQEAAKESLQNYNSDSEKMVIQ